MTWFLGTNGFGINVARRTSLGKTAYNAKPPPAVFDTPLKFLPVTTRVPSPIMVEICSQASSPGGRK
jgi:hypothetical protein